MNTRIRSLIKRVLTPAFALLVAASCLGQQSASARNYNIVATDGAFDPNVLTARPGEMLTVTVTNQGRQFHSIVFPLPQGYVGIRGMFGPWRTATVTFRAPRSPGQYIFYCPVYNHGAVGMNGTLIVTPDQ